MLIHKMLAGASTRSNFQIDFLQISSIHFGHQPQDQLQRPLFLLGQLHNNLGGLKILPSAVCAVFFSLCNSFLFHSNALEFNSCSMMQHKFHADSLFFWLRCYSQRRVLLRGTRSTGKSQKRCILERKMECHVFWGPCILHGNHPP